MITVMTGALAYMFRKLAGMPNVDTTRWKEHAIRYEFAFDRLAREHIYEPKAYGLPLGGRTLVSAARRP